MKRCKHIEADGFHHCGSFAFNLYNEGIKQGNYCDRHYWQDQAEKAREEERERIAKWYESEGHMMFPVAIPKTIRSGK